MDGKRGKKYYSASKTEKREKKMELNMKVLVKVAVMLFLVGITATVEARFDARSFIKEVLPNADANNFVKSLPASCIACTLSWPTAICICGGKDCDPPCKGNCICNVNWLTNTHTCNTCADEAMFLPGAGAMVFPGAGAH